MIDVIIPAYNAHETLEKCLISICAQVFVDHIQVIIVDDKSPNGGYKDIVDKYKHIVKIKEVKMDVNGGPGTARRVGVDNSNNPYMTFIDADDVFLDNYFLKGAVEALEAHPHITMLSASFLEETEHNETHLHTDDIVWVFGKVYRRLYWQQKGINFSDLRSNEDLELNAKIRFTLGLNPTNNKPEEILFVNDKIVYLWKFKEDSITRKPDDQGKPYEYSFNTGLIGAIDAKLSAYTFYGVNKEKVIPEICMQIPSFYNQIHSIIHERPDRIDFLKNVFNKMVEFWNKLAKENWNKLSEEEKAYLFNNRNTKREGNIMPIFLFNDFIKMLDEGKFNYEKVNS
jgi:glycosyltransferase involved in cell wall biosynthesis